MASTTVVPNGTLSGGSTTANGAATHHECVDETIASADDDTTYIAGGSGQICKLQLANMPSDFVSASAVTIRIRARRTSNKGDVGVLNTIGIYASDGTTAITDQTATQGLTTSYATTDHVRSITGTNTKTSWDGAVVNFTCSGDASSVRVTAVEVVITYTASAGAGVTTSKVLKMLLGCR